VLYDEPCKQFVVFNACVSGLECGLMTYFIARFPQHNKPISDPKPEDYLEAALWYRNMFWRPGTYNIDDMRAKAEAFERVYRRLKWTRETWLHRRPDEDERAG
jgi:hypothetical protein